MKTRSASARAPRPTTIHDHPTCRSYVAKPAPRALELHGKNGKACRDHHNGWSGQHDHDDADEYDSSSHYCNGAPSCPLVSDGNELSHLIPVIPGPDPQTPAIDNYRFNEAHPRSVPRLRPAVRGESYDRLQQASLRGYCEITASPVAEINRATGAGKIATRLLPPAVPVR